MFSWKKPNAEFVRDYLAEWQPRPFSYADLEITRAGGATRLTRDQSRVRLGAGSETFAAAQQLFTAWRMFPREMVDLFFPDRPLIAGTIVAVLFRAPGFWSLNPARIVYTIDDEIERDGHSVRRFGFAYGTLADHLEKGEEQFLLEWDRRDDSVWYQITAYSRPQHWLVWLGYPYARFEQSRFRRLSCAALKREVQQRCASAKVTV